MPMHRQVRRVGGGDGARVFFMGPRNGRRAPLRGLQREMMPARQVGPVGGSERALVFLMGGPEMAPQAPQRVTGREVLATWRVTP